MYQLLRAAVASILDWLRWLYSCAGYMAAQPSVLADYVRTRHRRAYPDMDFVGDEIAGVVVVVNTELIIHREVAASCRGLHAAVVPSGYQWLPH